MGLIYKRANSVIVWICPFAEAAEQAIESRLHESSDKANTFIEPQCTHGLKELFEAPYWSRAWLLQEFVLATRISIWLGQLKIDEETLLHVLRYDWTEDAKEQSENYPALEVIDCRKSIGRGRFLGRRQLSTGFQARRYAIPLLSYDEWARLLRRLGQSLQCTDPRDRVYALLSLLSPASRAKLRVEPEYSKTTRDPFIDIATSFHERPFTNIPRLVYETLHVFREALMLSEGDAATKDLLQFSKSGVYIREPVTADNMYRAFQ